MILNQAKEASPLKINITLHGQKARSQEISIQMASDAQQPPSVFKRLNPVCRSRQNLLSNIMGALVGMFSAVFILWSLEIKWADGRAVARNVLFVLIYTAGSAFLLPVVQSGARN